MIRQKSTRAFTLLELLLAAAICVIVAAMLIVVTRGALDLWRSVRGESAASVQAVQALDVIASDIAGTISIDGQAILACDVLDTRDEIARHGWITEGARPFALGSEVTVRDGSADFITAQFGAGGAWLRAVTTKSDTHSDARRASSPGVVSYQLNRQGNGQYVLCRSLVRTSRSAGGAAGTFEAGYDLDAPAYNSPSKIAGDPGTVLTPASIDAMAADVVDFGIVVYARSGGAIVPIYPLAGATRYRATREQPPVAVDVFLRILTAEGILAIARLEQDAGAGTAAASWTETVRRHSKIVIRRIALPSAS